MVDGERLVKLLCEIETETLDEMLVEADGNSSTEKLSEVLGEILT